MVFEGWQDPHPGSKLQLMSVLYLFQLSYHLPDMSLNSVLRVSWFSTPQKCLLRSSGGRPLG